MKPIIGMTIQYKYDENRTWFKDFYIRAIEDAGGIPLLLPEIKSSDDVRVYAEMCDGIMFTGGADIDPSVYGATRLPECGSVEPSRDAFEFMLLPHVCATGKPILGICRGIQTLNVALGGTLHQHIDGHRDTKHQTETLDGTRVREIFGATRFETNSYHHQAVDKLGEGLVVTARAEDGTVEAVELPSHRFFVGVQWHPEVSWERDAELEFSPRIFRAFVDACR